MTAVSVIAFPWNFLETDTSVQISNLYFLWSPNFHSGPDQFHAAITRALVEEERSRGLLRRKKGRVHAPPLISLQIIPFSGPVFRSKWNYATTQRESVAFKKWVRITSILMFHCLPSSWPFLQIPISSTKMCKFIEIELRVNFPGMSGQVVTQFCLYKFLCLSMYNICSPYVDQTTLAKALSVS